MATSWAEEVQDYQHERRVKVHPDLFKGRTVGHVRGENSKRERSYNPLLGRFLDEDREKEQRDLEEKVKTDYLNLARDVQLRKEAPYDLITHERKFEALLSEALDPTRPKALKNPVPDTAADYNIISNLRFDEHHWAHPKQRPVPKDRVPKPRMVPALLHKDFNILTNRYLEHHEEKLERDRELNLLEAAEKMRNCPFNPLSQRFCDARLEERMKACQDALTTEVKLRNEEAQPLSYRGNITNCYDMLSHQVKDPELMDYIKQAEGGRKVRYKTRFKFEDDVRRADVKQEDRVKRMKPLQIAHERFTTEMERGFDILTNQDFGHKKEKQQKPLHTPRTKPLLTPWEKVLEGNAATDLKRDEVPAGPVTVAVSPTKPTGEPVGGVLNLETLRLPDEASRSSALSARSARSTRSSQRRRLAEVAPPPAPPVPSIPGSAAGSVYSKAKET